VGAGVSLYEISDHLGNVRSVIGVADVQVYETDFESPSDSDFISSSYSRHDDNLVDHSDTGNSKKYTQLLNGGYAGKIGLAKSLDVSPGDIIKVEAYGVYRNLSSSSVNLSGFATGLTSAFGVTAPGSGDPANAFTALDNYGGVIEGGFQHHEDSNAPKAYLNILIFDLNYNLVDAAYKQIDSDAQQTSSSTPQMAHDYMMREITVSEPGYAFIFFSNENFTQVDIHFDDVKVTHTQSVVIAGADYYPFGLPMENRELTREDYRYGYQGQFSEKDSTTGFNHFELRMYDPRIGRWLSPDPYGQFASPYLGMGNIPHMGVDPDGGLCCAGVWDEALGAYVLPEVLGVTASRISLNALPAIASVVGRNMAGGQVFTGTDGGLYSAVPQITGTQYFQAIDDQWQLVHDEGVMRERYAQQLLDLHRVLADINSALITSGLGSGQGVVRYAGTRVTLNVSTKFNPSSFADDILKLNKATEGGGVLLSGTPSSAINSAMYYTAPAEQGASIFRSIISNHMFIDGNKRTAVAAFKAFAKIHNLPMVSEEQLIKVANQVATGQVSEISEIAQLLIK
jgi:RHS repeat-associated protein